VADERELLADTREKDADERDRAADQREIDADRRVARSTCALRADRVPGGADDVVWVQ
jgi:hypothetical protein